MGGARLARWHLGGRLRFTSTQTLADGVYTLRLTAWDLAGRVSAIERRVIIDSPLKTLDTAVATDALFTLGAHHFALTRRLGASDEVAGNLGGTKGSAEQRGRNKGVGSRILTDRTCRAILCHAMPRRPRMAAVGVLHHALNPRMAGLPLFEAEGDYLAFVAVLEQAVDHANVRLLAA